MGNTQGVERHSQKIYQTEIKSGEDFPSYLNSSRDYLREKYFNLDDFPDRDTLIPKIVTAQIKIEQAKHIITCIILRYNTVRYIAKHIVDINYFSNMTGEQWNDITNGFHAPTTSYDAMLFMSFGYENHIMNRYFNFEYHRNDNNGILDGFKTWVTIKDEYLDESNFTNQDILNINTFVYNFLNHED